MDAPRDMLVARLRAADRHGRFRAYAPRTAGGRTIIVHSKVAIIDDRLLRVGSANLNNRSGGYDTECDLAIEAPDGWRARGWSTRSAASANGWSATTSAWTARPLAEAAARDGRAGARHRGAGGRDRRGRRRLLPLAPDGALGPLRALVAAFHLGDPHGTGDAWRPWRRREGAPAVATALTAPRATAKSTDQRQVVGGDALQRAAEDLGPPAPRPLRADEDVVDAQHRPARGEGRARPVPARRGAPGRRAGARPARR